MLQEGDVFTAGCCVILPSSHTGSDCHMAQLFQDSIAVVRHFERPSLFITFTANPQWKEIKVELLLGQTAVDQPDLVAHIFHLKLTDLLQQLKHAFIFGRYQDYVWTVEYQRRGLLYMHLLLFLHLEDRFLDAHRVDQIVSAELPDPEQDPTGELAGIIRSVMTHRPCGVHNPTAPYMVNGTGPGSATCSKRYPRPFTDETMMNADGYPIYRRHQDGRMFTRSDAGVAGPQFIFDNC